MSKIPPPPFFILRGHEGKISCLFFTDISDNILKSSPTLISGSHSGEIFFWDLQTYRTYYKVIAHDKKGILYLNYYNSSLITQGRDNCTLIWKFVEDQWIINRKFCALNAGFCSAVLHHSQEKAFIFLHDQESHSVNTYNYEFGCPIHELKINSDRGMVMCMRIFESESKVIVITGYENGMIGTWDCESATEISSLKMHENPVICMDYDADCYVKGISGSVKDLVKVWRLDEDFKLSNVQSITTGEEGTNAVRIREDRKIVIIAGSNGNIGVFSWKTLKPLAVLQFHTLPVQCLSTAAFSVGRRKSVFASGSDDKIIALWTIY